MYGQQGQSNTGKCFDMHFTQARGFLESTLKGRRFPVLGSLRLEGKSFVKMMENPIHWKYAKCE